MKISTIVTRHPALVEYLQEIGLATSAVEVVAHATPDIVRGKDVCGVLPHSLSCLTRTFTEVPLALPAELRGVELTLEQVRQYAGRPVTYRVTAPAAFSAEVAEIARGTSTNGRWGIKVVGPKGLSLGKPQEGRLMSLGKIAGHDTFKFIPEPGSGKWYMVGEDLVPLAGCEVVCKRDIQSSCFCTLLVGGEFIAVKSRGYKGRSSSVTCYACGEEIKAPTAVLAAMGLIPCAAVEEVPAAAPPLPSPLAEALTKAGLVA